jgi:regulator of sigma E protease
VLRDMNVLQIALAILSVGTLIAWHELGHFLVARAFRMRVLKYSLGFGPRLWGFERGGIEYRLSAIPLGGYVQIFGMSPLEPGAREDPLSFLNAPRYARLLTILAGPAFNYALAFAMFFVFFFSWPGGVMRVDAVQEGSPAAEAGLEAGDAVFGVAGRSLRTESNFWDRLGTQGTSLYVARPVEGEDPRKAEATLGALAAATAEAMGATLTFVEEQGSPLAAAGQAGDAVWTYSKKTLEALGQLVAGDKEVRESTSGPPGIVKELKDAVQRGLADFLWLLAFLNVSLALLNLLPVPALDGIKALTLLVEGLLRRELNPYVIAIVNLVGFTLLLGLILLVSIKDLVKMVG